MIWNYILCAALGYLLCNINVALIVTRFSDVDLRREGSNNPGASNVFMKVGPAMGVLVAVLDILKTAGAVLLAKALFPEAEYIGYVTGVACVVGNIFPCFLRFKGGKGFAAFVGMTLGMNWQFFLGLVVIVALITLFIGYISLGTFLSIAAYPVYVFLACGAYIPAAIALVASAVILYRHWENIGRLRNGTEMRLDLLHLHGK